MQNQRQDFSIHLIWAFLLVSLTILTSYAQPKEKPITQDEIWRRGVVGHLGLQLGTYVDITGVVVKNESLAKATEHDPFALLVKTVDGKPLSKPVLYAYRSLPIAGEIRDLKIDDAFSCRGYETGAFSGVTIDPKDPSTIVSGIGFGFEIRFVVTKAQRIQSPTIQNKQN